MHISPSYIIQFSPSYNIFTNSPPFSLSSIYVHKNNKSQSTKESSSTFNSTRKQSSFNTITTHKYTTIHQSWSPTYYIPFQH